MDNYTNFLQSISHYLVCYTMVYFLGSDSTLFFDVTKIINRWIKWITIPISYNSLVITKYATLWSAFWAATIPCAPSSDSQDALLGAH